MEEQRMKKAAIVALVAGALTAMSFGGSWAGAGTSDGGQAAEVNVQADHRDTPALHPHPRGLP
jgi:hypothetical protein